MYRVSRYFFVILGLCLTPAVCFAWAESKHPIDELLIHELYLDSNYVFCGSAASWGTNIFGLFVFDRRRETWTNYSVANGFPSNKVFEIERRGDFVYVTSWKGVVRFNRHDGSFEVVDREYHRGRHLPLEFTLTIQGLDYRISGDSVIVHDGRASCLYVPSSAEIPPPRYPKFARAFRFTHPIVHQGKIFLAYVWTYEHSYETGGMASFDLGDRSFHFYPTDIFRSEDVTGSFLWDSSIILSTAEFVYEANARPAVGFVCFSPSDSSFSLWDELSLPEEPLALFQVEQDEKEFWIGTHKGVFRIDKRTGKCIHYQIKSGLIPKDGTNVFSSCGNLNERNESPLVAELDKGERVELIGVYKAWCEIPAPTDIVGFVAGLDVEQVVGSAEPPHPRFVQLKSVRNRTIEIKSASRRESTTLAAFDSRNPPKSQYELVGERDKRSPDGTMLVKWYKIRLPTAWVHRDRMTYCLGETQ